MNYLKFNFIVIYYLLIFIEPGLSNNSTSELPVNRMRRQLLSGDQLLQPEISDYLLKILPYKKIEPEFSSLKKISKSHNSVMTLESEVELSNEDLLKCEVIDANYIENSKSRIVLYTTGSKRRTKVPKLTEHNCFSFRLKTDGEVKIYLYTDSSLFNYTIITLGSNSNTKSYMSDNHRICENCMIENTPYILSSHELRGFWISWDENTVAVGKEGSTEILFSNTFSNAIDVKKIKFIGISTDDFQPASEQQSTSEWTIEEPFCPEVLAKPKEERLVLTKCYKIFDEKALSLKKLSEEEKLLKKVEAISLEFNAEESTTGMTSSRIENYYKYMKSGYFEEYINLYKKCMEKEACDKDILNKIVTTIDELRTKLKHESKITSNEVPKIDERSRQNQYNISHKRCSRNAYYSGRCICHFGFAGNGQYCNEDSDYDRVPDKAIPECSEKTECSRDNCPNVFNNDQLDANKNGVRDACENLPRSKKNCANITTFSSGDKCKLEWDFLIPHRFNQSKIELIFSQEHNDNILYKFIWHNIDFRTTLFELHKLSKHKEDDNFESATFESRLWQVGSSLVKFQLGKTYRFIINYESKSLRIRVEGLIDSDVITDKDIENYAQINKLCAKSDIKWVRGDHSCE